MDLLGCSAGGLNRDYREATSVHNAESVPFRHIDSIHLLDGDDHEREHAASRFEMASQTDFIVREVDMGMDPAVNDGSADIDDVQRLFAFREDIRRRHFRVGDYMKMVRFH